MNKNFLTIFLLASISAGCNAGSVPVVGIWKHSAVIGADFHAIARTDYIFTERPLTEPTVFRGLNDNTDGYSVICCIEVNKITPVSLKSITSRFKQDRLFAVRLESVKGAPYIYEAHPISNKKDWSPEIRSLADVDADPANTSNISAPVISGTLTQLDVPTHFEIGGTKIQLKNIVEESKHKITYQFTIEKRVIRLSEQLDSVE